jgi:hypothetical protein
MDSSFFLWDQDACTRPLRVVDRRNPAIEWQAAVEVMGEQGVGCRMQRLSDIK